MAATHTATIFAKLLKLLFNVIVMIIYRNGDEGYFMGGSNNENPDIEALCCGLYIGYLVYNIISLVCLFFDSTSVNSTLIETIMNAVGAILWVFCGGVLIQYWLRYSAANQYIIMHPQRLGIIMGVLTVINSVFFTVDAFFSYTNYNALKY